MAKSRDRLRGQYADPVGDLEKRMNDIFPKDKKPPVVLDVSRQAITAARLEVEMLHAACRDDAQDPMVIRIAATRLPDDSRQWLPPVPTYWSMRPSGFVAHQLWRLQHRLHGKKVA